MFERIKNLQSIGKCQPFNFSSEQSHDGRIGGNPPKEVTPKFIYPATNYFATLRISDKEEMSIFLTDDYSLPFGDLIDNKQKLLNESSHVVQIICHKIAEPGPKSKLSSPFAANWLSFGAELPDSPTRENIVPHHKIGGVPFFTQDSLVEPARKLVDSGWLHVVQFAFPSSRDSRIKGTWPFLDTVFHIFMNDKDGSVAFKYCWG